MRKCISQTKMVSHIENESSENFEATIEYSPRKLNNSCNLDNRRKCTSRIPRYVRKDESVMEKSSCTHSYFPGKNPKGIFTINRTFEFSSNSNFKNSNQNKNVINSLENIHLVSYLNENTKKQPAKDDQSISKMPINRKLISKLSKMPRSAYGYIIPKFYHLQKKRMLKELQRRISTINKMNPCNSNVMLEGLLVQPFNPSTADVAKRQNAQKLQPTSNPSEKCAIKQINVDEPENKIDMGKYEEINYCDSITNVGLKHLIRKFTAEPSKKRVGNDTNLYPEASKKNISETSGKKDDKNKRCNDIQGKKLKCDVRKHKVLRNCKIASQILAKNFVKITVLIALITVIFYFLKNLCHSII